ncbi:MAG: hypothetical protein ACTSQH_09605 [Candidatus Hodarchaeales archaeon]
MSQNIRVFKKRLQISQKKWATIQGQSLRTVNMILSIISRFNLTQRSDVFSQDLLTRFDSIQSRLEFQLAESINKNITELTNSVTQFSEVVKEMWKIEKQFRRDFLTFAKKRVLEDDQQQFHDLEIIDQAEKTIQEIISMYETELALRKQLISEIQESITPQPHMITAYLVLWSSEIYVETARIHELIEEFSFVEKIYDRFQQPESINSLQNNR